MNSKIFECLESGHSDAFKVDRLIVSAFLKMNAINLTEWTPIGNYVINENEVDEFLALNEFIKTLMDSSKEFTLEKLIEIFEFVVSPSDRIVNGAVYTPLHIREYIVSQSLISKGLVNLDDIRIADISCGCGGFLLTAAKALKKLSGKSYQNIFENHIFWLDIQGYSATRCILLLGLLALSEGERLHECKFNIHQGDALMFNWARHLPNFKGFDVIVGNPPYVRVRNLDQSTRNLLLNWSVCKIWNPDLYIPFFQIGYENLAPGWILGYITMNSFFKSLNWRWLREYFKKRQIPIRIIDFGSNQIFRSKSTYTCICTLKKGTVWWVEFFKSDWKILPSRQNQYASIDYEQLDSRSGWNLNNSLDASKIESIGIPFGKLFNTRHWLATLKNKIYIFKPVGEDSEYYHLLDKDWLHKIEKGICKDVVNANRLGRKKSLSELTEKIIFPYDNSIKPKLYKEDFLASTYPLALKYLNGKRHVLSQRDKGNWKYEAWYAFWRTQSLEKIWAKLFFPKISDKTPNFIVANDENLYFYNWQAVIGHSKREMLFVKKLLESRLFWYYITSTSKPYSSNYYSLNWNYIKNFGVCDLDDSEMDYVLHENDRNKLDSFFEKKYGISLN